jgi:hypothetical protein
MTRGDRVERRHSVERQREQRESRGGGLARYKPNGALDTTFSGDGRTTTDLFGGSDAGKGVALHEDGKIVVAGEAESTAGHEDFGLARYLGG